MNQQALFSISKQLPDRVPPGFKYESELITPGEERMLVDEIGKLPLKPFEFHGYVGKRRVASYGLRYDYSRQKVEVADEPPTFLQALLNTVADFAECQPEDFRQIGINEYAPGAGIGWHRDKPQFGKIVGISLLAAVKMRFRKRTAEGWRRASQLLDARSGYVLSGESREVWEHSIAPVTSLRYSVTFRTLASRE